MLAGVGVLLLAMGVGVLIGRSATPARTAVAREVVSVASPTSTVAATGAPEPPFSDSWPAGRSGYTVQLQALPETGTKVSAVEAAKASAAAKGARAVGALKSDDFSSLTPGNYVIYAGMYHARSEADRALHGLQKSFPGARVVSVSNGRAGGGGASEPSSSAGAGASYSHPAPPSVVESLHRTKGQSYEQRSKNLPDVISTG